MVREYTILQGCQKNVSNLAFILSETNRFWKNKPRVIKKYWNHEIRTGGYLKSKIQRQ